ncbi:hypothetical protein JANAI62_26620 [Jannaschia pagri]|uniref:Histidine kinase/HSP90-like ATPase domain-containing protein n=1 Tax=Jannaschia pagri TaxID=2829797 RepID=A0ABQ4NNR5_9RHOB|nr:hypothetical protein JANAI61_26620 [Jannaschia sp. AI_61]GIT96039.1 hypothetical protein JANAI62_26620 [Jannaschia sp. AI_62]
MFGTSLAVVLAAILSVLTTVTALNQPWIGAEKTIGGEGPGIAITGFDPAGPAADVQGSRILAIEGSTGRIDVTPADALEEPDVLPSYQAMRDLFANQGALTEALRAGPVTIVTDEAAATVTAAQSRPLGSLPFVFWIQILVAVSSLVLGGWAASLRPKDLAPWLFAAAGAGLALAIFAAALYSTRDLALPEATWTFVSSLNVFGAITFGAFMGSMMLIYPVRLIPLWAVWIQPVVFALWYLGNPLGFWASRATGGHLATAVEMGMIVLGLLAQLWATRKNPKERSIAVWFGISVVFGSGMFIALMAVPGALGYEPTIRQGHAFLLFLFVYLGLAIGVARFRMFDLGDWSFRIFYYAVGVVLLFGLDAALISSLSFDAVPAFSSALLIVVVLYLPFRDQLSAVLRRRTARPAEDLSDAIGAVALAPTPQEREARYRDVLEAAFRPLTIDPAPGAVQAPTLIDEGAALDVPGPAGVPPLRLRWTGGGRRLYAPSDLRRAEGIVGTIARLDALADARDKAVEMERARIDRDVHDNIGVQLLGALHSAQPERKNALIRQTLSDLRDIVANTKAVDAPLREVVADLRGEVGMIYEAAGLPLEWADRDLPDVTVSAAVASSLRAIVREATGNALRHSNASRVSVKLSTQDGSVSLVVRDDGTGIAQDAARGNGLDNLAIRAEPLGGHFALDTGPHGTTLRMILPFDGTIAMPLAGE